MLQPVRPFEHQDPERKSDELLRQEARARLGAAPPLQLVAELLGKLRSLGLPWWTPETLRARFNATERMRWLRTRPDLRQQITTALTGLAPKAARKKAPDFQGALIDSALEEGDVSVKTFEDAFDPADLALYGPADALWAMFLEHMPWSQDTPVHQELVAWLFEALLSSQSALEGLTRRPILTPWDARTAIDGRIWHTRMPLEIRVAIDEARFKREHDRPGEPFHAESDLSIAVASVIAASVPLQDLVPVFASAERAMGFAPAPSPEPSRSPPDSPLPPQAPSRSEVSQVPRPGSVAPGPSNSTPPHGGPQPLPTSALAVIPGPPRLPSVPPPLPTLSQPATSAPGTIPPPAYAAVAPSATPSATGLSSQSAPLTFNRPGSVAPPPPAGAHPHRESALPPPPPLAPAAPAQLPPTSKSPAESGTGHERPLDVPGFLMDTLGDIPSEEDRTNPWDITGDEEIDNLSAPNELSETSRRKRSSSRPR